MIYRSMFGLPRWRFRNPWEELERMRRQMESLYEDFEGRRFAAPEAGVFPLINLTEDPEKYYVRAELPGIHADELDIQVTGKNLALSGERKLMVEEGNVKYHRKEREGGSFSRMIALPGDVDVDRVSAQMSNGILTVELPKSEGAKPRKISVA